MIKVCYAVDADYAGGAERYILLIARELDLSRFEPVILARSGPGLADWCREARPWSAVIRVSASRHCCCRWRLSWLEKGSALSMSQGRKRPTRYDCAPCVSTLEPRR